MSSEPPIGVLPPADALKRAFDASFAEPQRLVKPGTSRFLALRMAGDPWVVATEALSGIVVGARVVPIPSPVPALLGLMGHRGVTVPVYDLPRLLGYPPSSPTPRWILLARADAVGLACPDPEASIELTTPEIVAADIAHARQHVRRVLRTEDGPRAIIDVGSVVDALTKTVDAARVAMERRSDDVR